MKIKNNKNKIYYKKKMKKNKIPMSPFSLNVKYPQWMLPVLSSKINILSK